MNPRSTGRSAFRKSVITITISILLIVTAVSAFETMRRGKPKVEAREIPEVVYNVDVFEAAPVSFTELLKTFGTARADREVVLSAQVSGEIIELHPRLRVGRMVSAGRVERSDDGTTESVDPDVLLRIDPRDYEQRVQQAESSIAAIKTEILQLKQQQQNADRQLALALQDLATLKEDYGRVKSLRERGAGSATDLSRALLELRRYEDTIVQLESQIALFPHQIQAAEKRLSGSESELQRAKNDLKRTVVTPPFRGMLAEVLIEQGQFIRAGEPLVRLIDQEKIEVPVSIGFEDYLLIQQSLNNGDYPGAFLAENETAAPRWTGKVVRVAPSADSASRTIEVYVEVLNAEQQQPLLPGTFVVARIEGPRFSDALLVPREAVIDEAVHVVGSDQIARRVPVVAGRRLQSLMVASSGLTAGDQVILTNLDVVRDGTRVAVQGIVSPMDEIRRMRSPVIRPENAADRNPGNGSPD